MSPDRLTIGTGRRCWSAFRWNDFNVLKDATREIEIDASRGAQPGVDAVAGEAAEIILGLKFGIETALAGETKVVAVGKIDVTFPAPAVSFGISPQCGDESLIAVRIGNFVTLPLGAIGFHTFHHSMVRIQAQSIFAAPQR